MVIPTAAVIYTIYIDWQNNREVFQVTGYEGIALYDLRSDKGVEVPEYAALIVLEITNKSRKPIYVSRADCLVDLRATRIISPREVLCAAFAGRPLGNNAEFVQEGLDIPTISNLGRRSFIAPPELPAGGVGYVTLLINHNPEPPFPEGKQLRLGGFDTSGWEEANNKSNSHNVLTFPSLDELYDPAPSAPAIPEEIVSYVGADIWLETTNGTRLEPVSIVSLVLSDEATKSMVRSLFGNVDIFDEGE